MIVLHGIYDRGKVEITDKKLPDIRAKIEINIPEKPQKKLFRSLDRIRLDLSGFRFDRDEANVR